MEKKLEKLLKNKVSPKFVAGLEQKLMEQYRPARRPFFFWRYSFAGASLMILIVAAVVVSGPFSSKNNMVADALEQYKSLQNEQGIFYTKEKIKIEGQVGVESEFGNEYISEVWHGDNGEFMFKGSGKKDAIYLATAEGELFTNDSIVAEQGAEKLIYCMVDKRRIEKDDIMGSVLLNVNVDDYSKYEVSSGLVGYKEGDDLPGEMLPEEQWRNDGRMPLNVLEEIKEDGDYEVEEVVLNGEWAYKVTSEGRGEVTEMYFYRDSLSLARAVYSPSKGFLEKYFGRTNVSSNFKMTIDYLDVRNITDVDAGEFFAPNEGMKQYYEGPGFISQVGCYSDSNKKLSEAEMNELLAKIPESAKKEVEKNKALMNKALDKYPERVWGLED